MSNVPAAARRQINAANRMINELNAKPGQVPAAASPADDTAPPAAAPTGIAGRLCPQANSHRRDITKIA